MALADVGFGHRCTLRATTMVRTISLSVLVLALFTNCAERQSPSVASPAAPAQTSIPPVVDGWREHPLRAGVIAVRPTKWRTDVIDVKVPAGKGLEYKVAMKQGETLVYNVTYLGLSDPSKMVSEFHGHTPQVNGVGDLMFYSKSTGTPQSGDFSAPWDGIHGWYLKNDSQAEVVVKLELAGFYELANP